MRVLAQSVQEGDYWIYRPLPSITPRAESEADANATISGSATIAQIFAEVRTLAEGGKTEKAAVPYSLSMLSGSMRPDNKIIELTESRQLDAAHLAADPEKMAQAGPTRENAIYEEIRAADGKKGGRRPGDICSTFPVRAMQTAMLQAAAQNRLFEKVAEYREKGIEEAKIPGLIKSEFGPADDGTINDTVMKIFQAEIDDFQNITNNHAEGVAPRTVEHFCRDKKYWEFVGVLQVTPEQVIKTEAIYDKSTGNLITPQQDRRSDVS